ncbi:BgTH12-05591 [Blumeria graminis f. sp. triticale]|uniref:BgTH12-05591 n=1 Tax=Blumeria graminis f. sp. triticale TaxID=1689686 RepID=A0A9W4DPD0_BLUGR|nr:BgTH12-05591 [Blumeria graminis f. sp. triticale]
MSEDGSVNQVSISTHAATAQSSEANDYDSSDSDDHFSDAHSAIDPTSINVSPSITEYTSEQKLTASENKRKTSVTSPKLQNLALRTSSIEVESKLPESYFFNNYPDSASFSTTIAGNNDLHVPNNEELINLPAHDEQYLSPHDVNVRSESEENPNLNNEIGSIRVLTDQEIPAVLDVSSLRHSLDELTETPAYDIHDGGVHSKILHGVLDVIEPQTTFKCLNLSEARQEKNTNVTTDISYDYNEENDEQDEGFGDDFDDFEEGMEDNDFGEFHEEFGEESPIQCAPIPTKDKPALPIFDFSKYKSREEVYDAVEPCLELLFPPESIDASTLPPVSNENSIFLTPRSASLWSQLVAPPPLQPPNWIRSRIRRLFLVSLGVPVDLDEILPASKQKKLVLPSISSTPKNSAHSRNVSRLRNDNHINSPSSSDLSGKPNRYDLQRNTQAKFAPELDLTSARQLCTITDEALNGLTDTELENHSEKLNEMQGRAKEVLAYWTAKTDEKLGDRDAFEGVIENLVKHARKTRK